MAVKGRPGDTDKAGVQSGGNKHQAGTINCEWPWPTPGPVVCLGTADSTLPRELSSHHRGVGGTDSGPENSKGP